MLHNEFMELPFYIMFYLIVSFYGLCIGSFLNVVIFRLPKDESLVKRASHCMTCGTKILWRDNIPVLGWLMLKGKCRSCGEPISKRYPIVESLNCIVYLIAFSVMDFSLQTILYCFFFSALICRKVARTLSSCPFRALSFFSKFNVIFFMDGHGENPRLFWNGK